jgi:hypothetical protein
MKRRWNGCFALEVRASNHVKSFIFIFSSAESLGGFPVVHTGCLIKNASTHNFFIYYPISMNKKTEDMVFHALRSSHKIIFLALFSVAYDSQLFFFNGHM